MGKRTPAVECSPENCGELFPKCGKASTYSNKKCRCAACREAARAAGAETAARKYIRNRDAIRAKNHEWYVKNAEAVKEATRLRRAADPEKAAAQRRRHYEQNRERTLAQTHAYYMANRDQYTEYRRNWDRNNPGRALQLAQRKRARKLAATVVEFTTEQWQQKCAYWGNKCYLNLPGFCTGGADTMDHVKPLSTDSLSAHMLANLRPACGPCNSSKHNKWPFPIPMGPS